MSTKPVTKPKEHKSSEIDASPSSEHAKNRDWKPPSYGRSQSWNEQDLRHQMQQRFTGMEKGREAGFTEMNGHGKKG
ncbi:predicted protein [Uncinocarpus reesii 1704]|uniref:Uncharacterized protein n=1 Tax=Uncinocarpus reesii (strain UAMH 1704) TaxID=336963 RepID=C4JXK8_UNCRE|nr:uncharacterized protein UREG_06381 [Uncinocarpus reesii 1704]EEP81516.1 predicted protein [Uncinocarpus reesii 1704]